MSKQFSVLILFLALFLFIFSASPLFSKGRTAEEEIELFGSLGTGDARDAKPIRVTKGTNRLEIEFTETLNVINLEIADEDGNVIYAEGYNTSNENQADIYLYGLEEGNYNISFTSESGEYLSGDFDLE